ncbi:MAG: UxaA family hydrolase [Planctomycetota bacterium]
MPAEAFAIDPADNVATALGDIEPGAVSVLGVSPAAPMESIDSIRAGHKLALCDIGVGQRVIKYGVAIGLATRPIPRGGWVHLHNLASQYDEASSALDLDTGAPPAEDHYV